MEDKTYKAEVAFCTVKQTEKATAKTPEGTWYIDVCFRCLEEQVNGQWVKMNVTAGSGDDLINKWYLLTMEKSEGAEKSMFEISKEQFKSQFDYEVSPQTVQEDLVGKQVNLVVTERNGYPNIKYVNNPNKKRNVLPPEKMNEFAALFGAV
jgi:nickel-dependent lactate racemase